MPEQTQIRRLEVRDAPDYRALRLHALRAHEDAFTSSFEEENVRQLADTEMRLRAVEAGKLWGAYVASQMVGMVGLSLETRIKNRHKGLLVSMYVAPEYTRRGLGLSLVDTVVQDARACGLELVLLTVTESNHAAIALYQKCGFTAFGTEPDAIRVNGVSFGKTHMYLSLKNN
jgi:ribosomal protein S18 acetylase RimI-like enzyme